MSQKEVEKYFSIFIFYFFNLLGCVKLIVYQSTVNSTHPALCMKLIHVLLY